ncbi:MAG: hypothetical protein OJF49_001880 [Ktedonobacterales bacterium]|nr:MAG: hypothetical protein OJF49_001880 [Ktedonobacterales bacterium]
MPGSSALGPRPTRSGFAAEPRSTGPDTSRPEMCFPLPPPRRSRDGDLCFRLSYATP